VSTIQKSIDVQVPVHTAYNQWTQFESFPNFMEGVEEVRQLSNTRTHWKTRIAGATREFDAEIVDQEPDQRIAWRSVEGPNQAGVVTFQPEGTDRTRVALSMDFTPSDTTEKIGAATNMVERRVEGDLKRFKEFIESRGTETGGWRGSV
jgi:uncharacterized membrane protein